MIKYQHRYVILIFWSKYNEFILYYQYRELDFSFCLSISYRVMFNFFNYI
uniref:Uncharacterized protein n=1 Tax=Arundo donax TaxID=35708 RepID=A0A0A9E0B3_ARUDO